MHRPLQAHARFLRGGGKACACCSAAKAAKNDLRKEVPGNTGLRRRSYSLCRTQPRVHRHGAVTLDRIPDSSTGTGTL